jgi:hypothetical protein
VPPRPGFGFVPPQPGAQVRAEASRRVVEQRHQLPRAQRTLLGVQRQPGPVTHGHRQHVLQRAIQVDLFAMLPALQGRHPFAARARDQRRHGAGRQQPEEQRLAMAVRAVVQPLHAALAEQRGAQRLRGRTAALDLTGVVEEGHGLAAGNAQRRFAHQAQLQRVGLAHRHLHRQVAVRVGQQPGVVHPAAGARDVGRPAVQVHGSKAAKPVPPPRALSVTPDTARWKDTRRSEAMSWSTPLRCA